jgi:microcystin degradation protein MlrC
MSRTFTPAVNPDKINSMTSKPKRVLLAGLYHETHTFLNEVTDLNNFDCLYGEELFTARGNGSPLAGAIEVGEECGWEIIPSVDMRAMPSGIVDDGVVEAWWQRLETDLISALTLGLDGIFLILHGAMTSRSLPDVEGELLNRIRDIDDARDVPIFGVTDLHGNISPRFAAQGNLFSTYRNNPHTDAHESSVRAARLLDQLMKSGQSATTVSVHPRVMWPPTGTATASEPMRQLEVMAREIESTFDDIWDVSVYAGFAFADTPDTGVVITAATVGDPTEARAAIEKLAEYATAHREEGNALEPPIENVIEEIKTQPAGPVAVVEPSDNIGGAAPGDCTGVLRAFVEHHVPNCAVVINDPENVKVLLSHNIGDKVTLAIGGKSGELSGGPVELEVELISRSDGKFRLEDIHSHLASMLGENIDMGNCAVVRHGEVQILLTTHKTPPFDLGQLRSQGIIPEELFAIGVKAAVAHRRAYDPITKASYTVGTPGPCSSDLKQFPFKLVNRPIFPLD